MIAADLYTVKEIGPAWNKQMLAILRESPVETKGLTICFDKSPDIFRIPELKSEHYQCAGFFKGQELVGFGIQLYYQAYVNGSPKTIGHLCNLYVKKEERGHGFFLKATDYFYKHTYKAVDLGYAIVMQGNKAAEALITRRYPEYPYHPYAKVVSYLDVRSILITSRKRESKKFTIIQADMIDAEDIVSLLTEEYSGRLFAPLINLDIFINNIENRPDFSIKNYYLAKLDGTIVGVCAAWDTKAIKQNRIIRYGLRLRLIKFLYSLIGSIFRFPSLPKKGEAVKDVVITDYAIKDRDPEIMEALLLKIYNEFHDKNYNMIVFGSCYRDPLLKAVRKFFNQSIISNIILATKEEALHEEGEIDTKLPFVDVWTL